VLYELLVGALPFDFQKLAFDEVLRCLREQDAPRPSTKLRALGGQSAITAQNRGARNAALSDVCMSLLQWGRERALAEILPAGCGAWVQRFEGMPCARTAPNPAAGRPLARNAVV
jgi:hypothetical protein